MFASKVKCELCPTECVLGDYEVGGCRVRVNRDGELYSLVYGKPCSVHVDPIEKKPFFHFLPATKAFSIATVGCTLGCTFCQNWEISQASPEKSDHLDLTPQDAVRGALKTGSRSVTFTYTEPTVFYEYMYDTAVLAQQAGLKANMHSCGYINERPLRQLSKHLDAADIDLKAFTEDFYGRICGGRLRPVLDSIVTLKDEGVWLEITNLVIPTLNDDLTKVREMCKWIIANAGELTPIHFSRFFPYYKLKNLPPTPLRTMMNVYKTAREAGLKYVYLGNLRSEAESTLCHNCNALLIQRSGYMVRDNRLVDGHCPVCGVPIPGVWS